MIDSLDATERTPYTWDATERVPRLVLPHGVSHVLGAEPRTTPFAKTTPPRRRPLPPPIPARALRLRRPLSPAPSPSGMLLDPRSVPISRSKTVEATPVDDRASAANDPIQQLPSSRWCEPAWWGVAAGSFVLGMALTLLATRTPAAPALAPSLGLESSVAIPTSAEPTPPSR